MVFLVYYSLQNKLSFCFAKTILVHLIRQNAYMFYTLYKILHNVFNLKFFLRAAKFTIFLRLFFEIFGLGIEFILDTIAKATSHEGVSAHFLSTSRLNRSGGDTWTRLSIDESSFNNRKTH